MKKTLGIKYQLRITAIIPVLVVSLLFAIFYNSQFGNDLRQHILRLGESYIKQLLPAAQLAMMRHDLRTLQGLIDASTINSDVKSLAFYNANGDLIAYRGGRHPVNKQFKPLKFTGDYVESKKVDDNVMNFVAPVTIPKYNLYSSDSFTAPKYLATNPLAYNPADDILGWLSIDLDIRAVSIKRYQMIIVTIIITLLGLLVSLWMHFFFSRQIYLPIARLRRSMKQILSNELETKIVVSSIGELGIIEQGSAHLQKKYLNIAKELNQHIEIATSELQQSHELLEEKNVQLSLEKKKAEEKSRQKSEFIANMSHEIRTPMNSIIGFSNVLLESQLNPLQMDYVKTVKSSAQDLLVILNDILDYSKIDSGKLHLDSIPLDLRACLDEVLTLAAPNAHRKGVELIPSTDIKVPRMLLGDPIRIKQILTNLVNNAIKFTDHGHVRVKISLLNESTETYTINIEVSDTGIGIAKEDQSKLFNAFNQADTSITRRFGGTGLGLVICKKLAEAMRGRITLASEPYHGSVFTVSIKLEKFKSYEMEKNQTTRLSHLKAICFDENPLYLESITNGLACLGIVSTVVHSPMELHQATLNHGKEYDFAIIGVNDTLDESLLYFLNHKTIPTILVAKYLLHTANLLKVTEALLFKPIGIQKLQETIELLNNPETPQKLVTQDELGLLRTQLLAKHPSILIAEDNLVNQMLLKSLLSQHARLELVQDGLDAVNACRNKQYDIILLDLQMPNLDGFQASERIRTDCPFNHTTPIVAITANSSESQAEKATHIDFDVCLHKPINEKQLLTTLLALLDKERTVLINWQLCIQKVSGNELLAKEYLAAFIAELPNERDTFLNLFHQQDIVGIANAAHKLLGACCFCGVPVLQAEVSQLEKLALNTQDCAELESQLMSLVTHIDRVIEEFKSHYAEPSPH